MDSQVRVARQGSEVSVAVQKQVAFVASPGQDLHADCITYGCFGVEGRFDHIGQDYRLVPQEVDPSRSVDQDHWTRLVRISSRSPSQPLPRRDRASSTLSASPASRRSAKLTASRLVASRKRAITAAHASSSISMFVRAIHQLYTPQIHWALTRRLTLLRHIQDRAADSSA